MAITVNPATGRVTPVGTYGPNEHRFEESARNNLRIRMGFVDPNNIGAIPGVVDLNQHLFLNPPNPQFLKTTATPSERHTSVSDPRGVVWLADGSAAYVSGMGSNNVVEGRQQHRRARRDDRRRRRPDGARARPGAEPALRAEPFRGTVSAVDIGDEQRGRAREFLRPDADRHQGRAPVPLRRASHVAARELRVRRMPHRRQPRHRGLGPRRPRRRDEDARTSPATPARRSRAPATTGTR